jgi:DNA-binding response OmpR family regulator
VTTISSPPRDLQATLIQHEADLRKLTSTVQALSSQLSEVGDTAGTAPAEALVEPADIGGAGDAAASLLLPRWRLREGGWTLVSPVGQRLPLTTLERKFMLALFEAPNRSLARNELGALASGRADAGDEKSATSPRGVDVMVSRLRRKAQALGMPLPLRSVRRWGYMFTEDVVIE